jgi:hypothetical protein
MMMQNRMFGTGPLYSGTVIAPMHYNKVIPGKTIGRYIDQPDKGDVADEHEIVNLPVKDGRALNPPSKMASRGFELCSAPTGVKDFSDDAEVQKTYYPEVEALVKKHTGASRVIVFDHTLRKSSVKQLNNMGKVGVAAGAVARVHCDYTHAGAPRRFRQLA